MSNPYNVFFDNLTGRVVIKKINDTSKKENSMYDREFSNKINELCNITKIEDKKIQSPNIINFDIKEQIKKELSKNNEIKKINLQNNDKNLQNNDKNLVNNDKNVVNNDKSLPYNDKNLININKNVPYIIDKNLINNDKNVVNNDKNNQCVKINYQEDYKKINLSKKEVFFGIKKTILSDFNYLNNSSNSSDFRISLNKNINKNNNVFDTFYLFPNIAEINTKNETNFINEKRVEVFTNINNQNDKQYFPIDFVACGINIPLKSESTVYKKLIIKNIFWNIFQSININKYVKDELLCIVPEKNDFSYKSIKLQINFELHSQVNNNIIDHLKNKILPYRNFDIKNITPANSCLYPSSVIEINSLNGGIFDNIEINLCNQLDIQCALLCIKISVPDDCISILKGSDKMDRAFYGHIPFSQFILNFDYNLI